MSLSQSSAVCTDQLMNNFMDALNRNAPEQTVSAPEITSWSSPDSHPSNAFEDEELLLGDEDLMLPDAVCSHRYADATVITSTSSVHSIEPPNIITTGQNRKAATSERRHSLPSSVILPPGSKIGNTLTQPVPEFLCHLFTMLRDENLHDVMSWEVPIENETDSMGGGIKGIGKIVCHQPDVLQESILGKYYRHSNFGFKKRLHGGKKGKLSPCSYVHEGLDANVESLLGLKRRPPLKKRLSVEVDADSVSSIDEEADKAASPKKRRSIAKGRSSKVKKLQDAEPIAVKAEEYSAPAEKAVTSTKDTNAAQRPVQIPSVLTQRIMANPAPASATLAQLLSTALPPTEVLFNDNFPGFDDTDNPPSENANGVYINDQGRCLSQNSLVNLAMFY
eukprot:scaffold10336_cov70-Cyclotella_meneghiniana.AAC.4